MMLSYQEAKDRLSTMLAVSEEPTLDDAVLEDLMRLARVSDKFGTAPDAYHIWKPQAAYTVGQKVVPTYRGHTTDASISSTLYIPPIQPYVAAAVWRVTVAGTSGATEPAWPLSLQPNVTTVPADGGVTWVGDSLTPWFGAWDLALAAAEGWRRKAGIVANAYRFRDQQKDMFRNQIMANCLLMSKEYAKKVLFSYSLHRGPALEYRYGRLIPGVETNWDG
jgi:hypothetical protein